MMDIRSGSDFESPQMGCEVERDGGGRWGEKYSGDRQVNDQPSSTDHNNSDTAQFINRDTTSFSPKSSCTFLPFPDRIC